MKSKILNDNYEISFYHAGMGIKLSSCVKSIHKYSLINQFLVFANHLDPSKTPSFLNFVVQILQQRNSAQLYLT